MFRMYHLFHLFLTFLIINVINDWYPPSLMAKIGTVFDVSDTF